MPQLCDIFLFRCKTVSYKNKKNLKNLGTYLLRNDTK